MRITQNMLAAEILANISGSAGRLAKAQEQLSSTKRINRASDDPQGSSLVLQMQERIGLTEAYQSATGSAQELLGMASATLNQVVELLQNAKDLAVQGSSDTTGTVRNTLADQVNQLLEELLSESNTQVQGRYLFAGTQTSSAPFRATRDGAGKITAVTPTRWALTAPSTCRLPKGLSFRPMCRGTRRSRDPRTCFPR